MLEFITVPHGTFAPYACAGCGGSSGPMIDTHRELIGHGRVYVCKSCVVRAARVLGLVKGKRMDELVKAGETVTALEQEIERLQGELRDAEQQVAQQGRDLEAASVNAEGLRNRISQLEQRARQHAAEWSDLVGAAA